MVHALLHRCYKMPFSNNAEVHPSLRKELGGAFPDMRLQTLVVVPTYWYVPHI